MDCLQTFSQRENTFKSWRTGASYNMNSTDNTYLSRLTDSSNLISDNLIMDLKYYMFILEIKRCKDSKWIRTGVNVQNFVHLHRLSNVWSFYPNLELIYKNVKLYGY